MSVYRNDGFILKRMADVPVVFYPLKRSRLRDYPVSFGDSPFQCTSGVPDWEGEAGEPWGHTREETAPARKGSRYGHLEQGSVCCFTPEPKGEAGPRGEGWVAPLQRPGPGLFGRQPLQRVLCPQQASIELAEPPHLPE